MVTADGQVVQADNILDRNIPFTAKNETFMYLFTLPYLNPKFVPGSNFTILFSPSSLPFLRFLTNTLSYLGIY
jgi:hypothetical protein